MRKIQVTILILIPLIIIASTAYYEIFIRKGYEQEQKEIYFANLNSVLSDLKKTKKVIIEKPNNDTQELEVEYTEYTITDEDEVNEIITSCSNIIPLSFEKNVHSNTLSAPKIFKFYDEQDNLIVDYDFVYFMNHKEIEKIYALLESGTSIELYKKYYPENWKTED